MPSTQFCVGKEYLFLCRKYDRENRKKCRGNPPSSALWSRRNLTRFGDFCTAFRGGVGGGGACNILSRTARTPAMHCQLTGSLPASVGGSGVVLGTAACRQTKGVASLRDAYPQTLSAHDKQFQRPNRRLVAFSWLFSRPWCRSPVNHSVALENTPWKYPRPPQKPY